MNISVTGNDSVGCLIVYITGGLFLGVYWPCPEGYRYSSSTDATRKHRWRDSLSPSYVFMAWYLNKLRYFREIV